MDGAAVRDRVTVTCLFGKRNPAAGEYPHPTVGLLPSDWTKGHPVERLGTSPAVEWCRIGTVISLRGRNNQTTMADTLVTSLRRLAREKRGLKQRGQLVAQTERRLLANLTRLLPTIGYRLVPLPGHGLKTASANGVRRAKRLPCPKCDRRFAHPLPLARHLSATHGIKKTARKAGRKATKKPA